MVRVFAMCLSMALIVLGVVGVTLGAAHWLIALDFARRCGRPRARRAVVGDAGARRR